jgi:hypothetical protein
MPAESITVAEILKEWRSLMRRDRRRACPRPVPGPPPPVPEAEAPRRAGRPPGVRGKYHRGGTSKYYGVYFLKASGRWEARVQSRGVTRRGGTHATEEAAARAADRVSRELFGDKAILNFPEGEPA